VDWENIRCALFRQGFFPAPEALLERIVTVTAAACARRAGRAIAAPDVELYLVRRFETWRFDDWLARHPVVRSSRVKSFPPWGEHFDDEFAKRSQRSTNKNMVDIEMILRALEKALLEQPTRSVVLVSNDSDVIRGAQFICERVHEDRLPTQVAVFRCGKGRDIGAVPASISVDREQIFDSVAADLCWSVSRREPTEDDDVEAWVLRNIGLARADKRGRFRASAQPPVAADQWEGPRRDRIWGIVRDRVAKACEEPAAVLRQMSAVDTAIRRLFAIYKFDLVDVGKARTLFEASGATPRSLEAAVMAGLLNAGYPRFVRATPEWAVGLSIPATGAVLRVLRRAECIQPGSEMKERASCPASVVPSCLKKQTVDLLSDETWLSQPMGVQAAVQIGDELVGRVQRTLNALGLLEIDSVAVRGKLASMRYWTVDLTKPMNAALQTSAIAVHTEVRRWNGQYGRSEEELLAFIEGLDPESRWFLDGPGFLDALAWGGVLHQPPTGWAPS
jgi:hypothetical protein